MDESMSGTTVQIAPWYLEDSSARSFSIMKLYNSPKLSLIQHATPPLGQFISLPILASKRRRWWMELCLGRTSSQFNVAERTHPQDGSLS